MNPTNTFFVGNNETPSKTRRSGRFLHNRNLFSLNRGCAICCLLGSVTVGCVVESVAERCGLPVSPVGRTPLPHEERFRTFSKGQNSVGWSG